MIVSMHARARYVERVDPSLTPDEAAAEIAAHARVIDIAASFGAPVVRLGNGAKLVLRGDVVATVLPRGWICWRDVEAR